MPEAGQVQVELNEVGVPSAVWVVTPNGRFTVAAYAAPKSAGLWREVATELADSLRKDAPEVQHRGRPVGPRGRRRCIGAGVVRFIGVDGYRWMIRCVVERPAGDASTRWPTRREKPWRTPSFVAVTRRCRCAPRCRCSCPSRWPRSCGAAAEQAAAQQAGAAGTAAASRRAEPVARRSEQGSAMQQLRTITGG